MGSTNSENGKDGSDFHGYIKYLAILFKQVGLVGFIAINVVAIFWIFGSSEQKQEFINIYILQKHDASNMFPCTFVIIVLMTCVILGSIYFGRMLKAGKEERNRLGEEKTKWQTLALNRELGSSR